MPRHLVLTLLLAFPAAPFAAEPLSARIDQLISAKASNAKFSNLSDNAEFLRRIYLDLAGRIPARDETARFLADASPTKRSKLIDDLLNGPDFPTRMSEQFHVMFMERLGDHADWSAYLLESFKKNKPWNQIAKEILRADGSNPETKGSSFFMSKRLEHYGQQTVDYSALTRDIGRLFLGKDLRCAECHDHLFIEEYKQKDFKGLFAFVQNAFLNDEKTAVVGEKPMPGKVPFMSVFKKIPKETGPGLPGGKELEVVVFKKGEEYAKAPDPKAKSPGQLKFSPLTLLSEQVPSKESPDFARNITNRIWFLLLGRGIVHPLDLHHAGNPPSHPELLALLADEFVAHGYDIKWLITEITRSQTYQRSGKLPEGVAKAEPQLFVTSLEKRLSAEQLIASFQTALNVKADPAAKTKIMKAYANAPREPEDEISPMLKGALFLLNDPLVLGWLAPQPGNVVDQLSKKPEGELADEVYLTVLSRKPTDAERQTVNAYVKKHEAKKAEAVSRLVWALLASTEFGINH
ncbi:DUF1549 domain-containing protein [Zavarzinella formosa]|uniref:DUF1549 domain-containing protein n=1 Tax=Zavarzinella formosa TaxID=360055 RepID=UPI0003143E49|nr:DUF1549 domain-containing protein [Zavarzinella formosa]